MTIAFPRDACIRHSSPARLLAPTMSLMLLFLLGCTPKHEAARLEARPSGKYGEKITWVSTATVPGPRHRVDLEVEIDEAQLMGWSKTNIQYNAYLDVRIEQPGREPVEQILLVPVTERRVISESKEVIQVAYQAAGVMQPSGFRLVQAQTALDFKPVPGEQQLSVHLRTPAGAERMMLKAIRTVRLKVLTSKATTGVLPTAAWAEQEREVLDY